MSTVSAIGSRPPALMAVMVCWLCVIRPGLPEIVQLPWSSACTLRPTGREGSAMHCSAGPPRLAMVTTRSVSLTV